MSGTNDKRVDEIEAEVRADFERMKLEYVATQFQSRADNIMEELRVYARSVEGYDLDEDALVAERKAYQEGLEHE